MRIELQRAASGLPQAHDGAQSRRLACAVTPQQHGYAPSRHIQIHTMKDVIRADVRMHIM
ncbi:hypothetical protein H558_06450 [Bordetella holmesii H558]|nr:hypothetical protein H558_06450 [Bordetella holmesii H558]AOB34052.1 hypothetical protein BBB42_00215 [Bordetella holmesii]